MKSRIMLFLTAASLIILALAGPAMAANDGIARVPATSPVAGTAIVFPMSATTTDTSWAIPIYDVEFINPADGGLPIKVDGIAFTLTGALAAQVTGVKATLSGANFTNTDSVIINGNSIVTAFTPANPFDIDLGVGDGAATADSQADLFSIADGDTVRLTLYAFGTAITNAATFTVDIGADADIVIDASGADFATKTIDGNAATVTGRPAADLATTSGDVGGLDLAVNVPSVATSKSVAVPVFQFKLRDRETATTPVALPTRIDGLTIPITLAGGLDADDIVGASVEITSSTPVNTVSFHANSAGGANDREINTADDANAIQLITVVNSRELRLGTHANITDSGAGTGDLLEIPDPGTADTDYEVVLTVKIWLASSGLTANSTATFNLGAGNVTLSGVVGTDTDPINPFAKVSEAVATVVTAGNQNTTLSDRGVVPNTLTLPSGAINLATAYSVFDFFINDGVGGQSTKIDSLTIPVTLSGGAKFGDLAGAKLSVDNGAGIILAFSGGISITTSTPTLANIDSISATEAQITFKGQVNIDTTDAIADLLEIPDGGTPVSATLAVWVDTSDIAYGATFTFDLQNQHVTLTGVSSDGLASNQNITNTVVSVAVGRIVELGTVANPTNLSSAAIQDAADADGNASAVFDFQIVDPLDGNALQIDAIRIPLVFGGSADINDIAGVQAVVSGLSTNDWGAAGAPTTTIESVNNGTIIEIDATAVAIDIGALATGGATGGVDALTIPDGETATITIALWLSTASLVDSSTVGLSLDRDGILLTGTTTGIAASQSASGTAVIRATTLADNDAVQTATSLSNVNTGTDSVAVFGFKIVDPADTKSTKIDRIVLTAAGTGADADIVDVLVTVSGATFNAAADDVTDGILRIADAGMTDSGTFPVAAQTITMGAAPDADGTADLIEIADGTTATFVVSVITADGLATAGNTITFDLTTSSVSVDGGDASATNEPGSAIATAQDLTNKTVTVTSATTLIADLATVPDAVAVTSLANTTGAAVAVFDFTITDAAGVNPTNIDALTIPVTFSGVDFADVAGVVVTTTGTFNSTSNNTDIPGNTLNSLDAGLELQSTTGGMNILLGGAASGVTTIGDNTAQLIAASAASINITVAVYLDNSSGALTDGSTMTFSLGSSNFVTDATTSDTIISSQSITPGVGTIAVEATKLIFTAPTSTSLAADGVSDTVKVVAADVNNNVDKDYATTTSVSTNTGTGQFSQNSSLFLGTSTPYSATPANGVLAFFYKDSAAGTSTLTASSGALLNGTFSFTVQAFTLSVTWSNPAVADTTATDSAGTFHLLQYTVNSNDSNLLVEFWASTQATYPTVSHQNASPLTVYNPVSSTVLGMLRNPSSTVYGPGANKASATDVPISVTSQNVYTSVLSAGTWYIYMVRADGDGISAGGDTLARSGALNVLHYPGIVAFGLTEAQDGTVDSGTSFSRDSGGNSPNTSIDLLLYAEDHNSNDDISLYVSTNANLTDSTVTTDTTSTYQISGTTNWKTDDVGDTLRYATVTISDSLGSSAYHPKGTYYYYALVTDAADSSAVAFARAENLSGAQQLMTVNHAPTMTFSEPSAAVTNYSVNAQPQLTLAWNGSGTAGDQDIDDNADISLWFALADSTPDVFADTSQGWLKKIVSGIKEDPDGGGNDQYAWDLTQFDGQLPAAASPIKVWALLQDEGTTPVFVATPQITFAPYVSSLVLLNPPPGPATEIRESETYRFFFDADYVSDAATNGTVRYFISSMDTTSLDAAPTSYFTFDTGASSTFPGNYNSFWISGDNVLKEGVNRFFDWTPKDDGNNYGAEIVPQTATTTTFYLYAAANITGNALTSLSSTLRLARAPGRIKINGIGTTLSNPATSASPNQAQVTADDTIRVLLRGNTNNTAVQGMQLYINIDSTKFAIADQNAATAGVQPFGFETSYFFGSVPAQINRVNLDSLTYKLDLDKRNLSAPADPTGQVMAHVDLVARSFTGVAYVNWNLDRVNDPNRIPLFFNASGDLGAMFANPLATFTPLSRGTISGTVPLQGANRTSDSKVTTFWLRPPGSWISVSDTSFVNTNDDSTSLEGVQQTTGTDGSFTLTKVPAGIYELVAKSESYLAGYAPVSVVNGQSVSGVTPTRISAINDPGQLLGGDINGDNKIDASDESALNLAYETTSADSTFNSAADIDDDGTVLLSDLLILAANLQTPLLTGIAPVYKPAVNDGVVLSLSGLPLQIRAGEEFEVALELEGAAWLAGYSLGLDFDPAALEVVEVETPLLDGYATVQIERLRRPDRYVLAEAVKGGQQAAVDDPLLARVRFRALGDVAMPALGVGRAYLADQSGYQVELAVRMARALPEHFSLLQNRPNPFNPSTQITFDVPLDEAAVELTIFNVMGQPIRHLLRTDGVRAGRYRLTWDGRDDQGQQVGSGIYLYTLRAGDFVQSRKMVMMK